MKHKRSLISIAMAAIVLVSLCAVCVSTSVSAAAYSGSSGTSVKASPGLVGGRGCRHRAFSVHFDGIRQHVALCRRSDGAHGTGLCHSIRCIGPGNGSPSAGS